MPRWIMRAATGLLALASTLPAAADGPPVLAFPVACEIGKTCFIQKYVDHDPGPDMLDYACGSEGENGHDGIDFRLLSVEAAGPDGVAVLAAAPGTVKNTRDGVPERFITTEAERQAVMKIGCGNAVVIDHGGGWTTYYCHMKQGSIRVKTGDQVATGTPLGLIGFSGLTQYMHVHFGVRRANAVVDPFTGEASAGECFRDPTNPPKTGLWQPGLAATMPYETSFVLETGFAGNAVTTDALEQGHSSITPASATSPALVFYARVINMLKGDQLRFTVTGPSGFDLANTTDGLDRNKATWVAIAGRKRSGVSWAKGRYEGKVEVLRGGQVVRTATGSLQLD